MDLKSLQRQYLGFLNTPSVLLDGAMDFSLFHAGKSLPTHLDLSPGFEIPENVRLGHRMEFYMQEALNESGRYQILAKNLQIVHQKETVGEFDYLVWDRDTCQVVHIELAYKFYLFIPEVDGHWSKAWQGVNRRDTLYKKLDIFRSKQLPLLFDKKSLPYLEKLDIDPHAVDQRICLKGQLFTPISHQSQNVAQVNSRAISGNWLGVNDLQKIGIKQAQLHIPPQSDWVSWPDAQSSLWIAPLDAVEILRQMWDKKESSVIWLKYRNGDLKRHFFVTVPKELP